MKPDWRQICEIDREYLDWMECTGDYSRLVGFLDDVINTMSEALEKYRL